jgi:hypothetical protein
MTKADFRFIICDYLGAGAPAIPNEAAPLVAVFDEWAPRASIPGSLVTDNT